MQEVWIHLLARDGAVLRRYDGERPLEIYVGVIARPCAHEYAIDRYSSGRLGGQPGLIGCPDCGLFGSTLYLELSIDTAFTSTYSILGAYTSYGISNQLTYYGLPQLSANPGATIKITNMPNISAANCPKQASLHLVIQKISSGYVFTDTSPLSITCIL